MGKHEREDGGRPSQGRSAETDLLVAVLRRPEGLTALLSRVRDPKPPPPWPEGPDPLRAWRTRFETVEVPLVSVPKRVCAERDRILAAWSAIGAARWDSAARFHLRALAIETVPAPDARAENLARPEGDVHPSRPLATAAHPRAYRGTLRQPPKRRRTVETDLRPYVCHPKGLAEVLHVLGGDCEEDTRRLGRAGYDEARLALAAPHAGGADFGLAYHHGGPRPSGLTLPPWFATAALPLLRGLPWAGVRRCLAACGGLCIQTDPDARACVVRLLARTAPAFALDWLSHAVCRPTARQAAFLAIVAESNDVRRPPPAHLEEYLARLDACTTETLYARRLRDLLFGIEYDTPLEYAIEGIELAGLYSERADLCAVPPCDAYPAADMRALAAHIKDESALSAPGFVVVLWERFGVLPGLADMIQGTAWCRLSPAAACLLLGVATGVVHHDVPWRTRHAKWQYIRRQFPRMVECVQSVPEDRQEKLIESMRRYFQCWDSVEDLERWWPAACSLASRLALPPFDEEELASIVVASFVDSLPAELSTRVLAAPDRCFLTLEEEVERGIFGNSRMEGGMETLARLLPEMVAEGFLRHPRSLLRTAKVLGNLFPPDRRGVIETFKEHPVNDPKLLARPIPDVCELLVRNARAGANPVPRRLREFVERGRTLTTGQIERHRRVLGERLLRVRLDLLGDLAVEAMGRGLPLDRRQEALRHALEMLQFSDRNRRGLRRLLQAIADGKPPAEYLLGHPATQAWLRRHPRVDAAKWTRGINFALRVRGVGDLDLAVEQDPIEALRLGTYVGTCLGVGQICAYSAAAVVLDVNKQVVYARNARGRVVARQLVALSEDDRLVCFEVYPESTSDDVKGAFLEFDLRFAEALGLPLYEEEEGDMRTSEIAHLLSQEWWDDSVWDVFRR